MSFDKDTRNLLAKTVAACRRRLVEDVTDQLRGVFGLHPDGVVLPLEKLTHLSPDQHAAARRLRDLLDHYTVGGAGKDSDRRKGAYERMVQEVSFTVLNRLTALRLCEERGLVIECVRKGTTSAGFQIFERITGGALGGRYDTYRVFLECLFDELALDLGVLFDRMTPQSAVFPSERCMEDILAELNKTELTHLWTEDETIGWVYQYFNPPEERKAMREASQAPRNSRELAVRNQFFTPRYIVEFLTDNTLARIWYEMHKGDTGLKDECRCLMRRPNEVFLRPGEKAPAGKDDETGLSQEELFKRPVYIEHRPKKDPRDLRILDPACGSGHFLLYSFDLLERIYEEAWGDPESPKSEITGRTLQEDFETLDDLRRDTPKLIVEHNLHGIDIDPRAVQIAALALWLRAQKTWKNRGLKAPERPRIARSNIVTAEPMPGEEDMRREFTANLKPRVLGQIVEEVFERMKLAGEAGSLLKIEEEIKDALAAAKKQWEEQPKPVQMELFGVSAPVKPVQMELRFDVKGITDERFWEQAEDRILDALQEYAEQAENGRAARRKLFADDAARGFAFIDLCRKHYDVVLMNPPFGNPPIRSRAYLSSTYPELWADIYAAFVGRIAGIVVAGGRIGAITSRTFLALSSFGPLRDLLLDTVPVRYMVECGLGVLDEATVRAAFFVAERSSFVDSPIMFWDLRNSDDREVDLLSAIGGTSSEHQYIVHPKAFRAIPGRSLAYWLPETLLEFLGNGPYLDSQRIQPTSEKSSVHVAVGASTTDDLRFVRCYWEVCPNKISVNGWSRFAHATGFARYYSPTFALLKWFGDGRELMAIIDDRGNIKPRLRCAEHFFEPGLVSPYISERGLGCSFLPPEHIVSNSCRAYFNIPNNQDSLLAYLNSVLADLFVWALTPDRKHEAGIIASIPIPVMKEESELGSLARKCWTAVRNLRTVDEADPLHYISFKDFAERISINQEQYVRCQGRIDKNVVGQGATSEMINRAVSESGAPHDLGDWVSGALDEDGATTGLDQYVFFEAVLSHAVGACFGRWDVRIALDPSLAPTLPDPFDPLPVCPPGMLVGPDGLPVESNHIVSEEWLRARPDANTLPRDGSVKIPTIPDSGYPLRISWDGVLVDDPGFNGAQPHGDDIVHRVREVFDLFWKDKAHEIEQEACDILGVSDLRDCFRRPTGFFQDHLKRYSKSRRKAPIYWPLSTSSGSYTIWLYYHRLNEQTLYGAVNKYVEPKIAETERGIARIEHELKAASGRDATRLNDRLNEARVFLGELRDLREELLRIAALPYKPDLNDGVIINAAPFYKLFRLRSWAKDTEDCWKKLGKGDYDWAHLAYTMWPDRVREVCRTDRSIAIAHGLEGLCEAEAPESKEKGGRGRRKEEAAQ